MSKYITNNSKIKVIWRDLPENNTITNKALIKNRVSKEYGIDKSSIAIQFIPSIKDKDGNLIEINGANMDNILDSNYQQQLFKEWIERENIDVDFDSLLAFDKEIENDLNGEFEATTIKNWSLKWLKINNFLSYGEGNQLNFNELKGLNIVKSFPGNFSGKTTLTVDAILFLFLGKTSKTTKNEEIFNRFTEENKLNVEGLIEIPGGNLIINRKLTRTEKRGGGWNIKSSLTYTRVLADGTKEQLSEEDAIKTTLEIKKMVGNEDTFNLTIITTGDNLMELISSTPTENGKLMNKLIGLEAIEAKEVVARKRLNEFKTKLLSNLYSPVQLIDENEEFKENIEIFEDGLSGLEERLVFLEEKKVTLNEKLEGLLTQKKPIDLNINQLDKNVIESDIQRILEEGKEKAARLKEMDGEIEALKGFNYDEVLYLETYNNKLATIKEISDIKSNIEDMEHKIQHLTSSDKCPTCSQKLPDVDNTDQIKVIEDGLKNIKSILLPEKEELLKQLDKILEKLSEGRTKYDLRNKLEIERDRLEVLVKGIRAKYKERSKDLEVYNSNEEAIIKNNEINMLIGTTKTEIKVNDTSISELNNKIFLAKQNILTAKERIDKNLDLVEKMKVEANLLKVFTTYVDMVGKKGINKIVIRSILPIINSELDRMLDETAEFNVSVEIDNKNEIEFFIVKDDVKYHVKSGSGYEKTVASLALRCVLSRVSQLPMPNFITFDEVLGKIAPENYHLVRILFDKIKEMYPTVLLIVQEEGLNEWGDRTLVVQKKDNISSIL